MAEANFFTDGEAYERLMGRWSRLVGQKFLDWLDIPMNLRWLDQRQHARQNHQSDPGKPLRKVADTACPLLAIVIQGASIEQKR